MIDGKNRIGYSLSSEGSELFQVFSPVLNELLPECFYSSTEKELLMAVDKATKAQTIYKKVPANQRAGFLLLIAKAIDDLGDELIERAHLETGFPVARLEGERARTTAQLRLFADVVAEGSWVEASIDLPDKEKTPVPKPDIRKMLIPLGVTGVFTASNFPLAFSTAGGDTASALAAGNVVIVKCHPYHAGTNELVSTAILKASKAAGMPDGVFSSLNSEDFAIGQALVLHPDVKAISFTGSFKGGKALYDLAQSRKDPIPVFTEMGSVNPVILLSDELEQNYSDLADKLSSSILMGAGQFCTNPGLLISLKGKGLKKFTGELGKRFSESVPQCMLHPNIRDAYNEGLNSVIEYPGVEIVARSAHEPEGTTSRPVVAKVTGKGFLTQKGLSREIFGPFSLIVECNDIEELLAVIKSLDGQLTATIMGSSDDISNYRMVIDYLQEISGRIIFNGVPTGVEVCYSMHHGGPYPATSDARFTSVGADAIKRFVRPIAFQDTPEDCLPEELKSENPRKIWRRVDGSLTIEKIFSPVEV